ncbi:MAG: NACHT domain-containing NTPase [Candidatus Binatia bacterium]
MTKEIEATKTRSEQEGNKVLDLDLGSYGSEDRLVQSLFENDTFVNWTKGNHNLYIFLDSLDEGLLHIKVLSRLLTRELNKVDKQLLPRLYLRIACRTADWPLSLETRLQGLWGEKAVQAYELVFLRQEDVIEAAKANSFEPNEFLSAIDRAEIVPLATKPITLNFLLNLYRKNQSFPKTRTELYQDGCRLLCEEPNPDRRETRLTGNLSAEQRLLVAARIAAVTIFTNRYAVWNDVDRGDIPDEDVAIRDLAGGKEKAQDNEFEVSEEAVKEALKTGLFSVRGANCLGWAHQTYAEFLAAYYLVQSGMLTSQMMSLIVHPGDQEGKLVPQLHETAAWLAAMVPAIFQQIMKTNPEVLLRSDVATAEAQDRAALVEVLLNLYNEEKLFDFDREKWKRYRKLSHPNLDKQLRPYIVDKRKNLVARRVAIDIAETCKVQSLQEDLVTIALDPSQPHQIRIEAAGAVSRIGEASTKAKLKPLAMDSTGNDPDDELRGYALQAVWPVHITVEELLTCITPPKRSNLIGAYNRFLRDVLPQTLPLKDLPAVLTWIAQQPEYDRFHLIESFINAILLKAWEHLAVPEISEAFARAVLLRLKRHEEILRDDSSPTPTNIVRDDTERRHILLQALVNEALKTLPMEEDAFYSISRMVLIEDIPWMIERLEASAAKDIQRTWAVLIEKRFRQSELTQTDTILTACQRSLVLAELFSWLREPVGLDSPEAEKARAVYIEEQRWQNERKNHTANPLPTQRIANLLDKCESGNLDAWWQLTMEMALRPNGTYSHNELEPDLTVLSGWEQVDTITRRRILEAAKKYIIEQRPEIQKWLEGNTVNLPTFAGYKALLLLQQEEPKWFTTLTPVVWQKWAPTILAYSVFSDSAEKQNHQELVKMAYDHAPTQIIETLMVLVDKENEKHGFIFITRKIEGCLDDRLASALTVKLQDEKLHPKALGCLLCVLLDHNVEDAKAFVSAFISSRSSSDEKQRSKVIIAASALLTHANDAGWSIVWPVLQEDDAFGREVITAAVYDFREKDIQITRMTENQLADFYIWLSQQYPHTEDPQPEGAHEVSARESIADFRDSVLRDIKDRGTLAACSAIEKISRELPHLDWLKWILLEARNTARQKTWLPPQPSDVLAITKNQQGRLVQSGEQLLEVLLESLQRLEQRLQGETPQVEFLWDQVQDKQWKPKDENSFSNYVKNHLDLDLKQKGIIVNREVEIRRKAGGRPGERVDIQVDAISKKPSGEEYDRISAVIEVKGCWHDELDQAMKTQLIDRYLNEARCQHGLYLVGWFDCPQWTPDDLRRKQTPKLDLEKAREKFKTQAAELSQSGVTAKAFVINTALR